jgi:hypothetical protein
MASTFLTLTNKLLRRQGHTTLTSSNFSTTTDPKQLQAKDYINDAIRDINITEIEWPFYNADDSITCVAGTNEYALDSDTKSVDWDSFQLNYSASIGNNQAKLALISYDEWLSYYSERDGNAQSSGDYGVPKFIYQTPDNKIGVTPKPDDTYIISFSKYSVPTDLSTYDDEVAIPTEYDITILAGAMVYVSLNRGSKDEMDAWSKKFKEGVSRMRTILTNKYTVMRSGQIQQPTRRNSVGSVFY